MGAEVLSAVSGQRVSTGVLIIIKHVLLDVVIQAWAGRGAFEYISAPTYSTAICRSGVTHFGGARAALQYQPVGNGASPRQELFAR